MSNLCVLCSCMSLTWFLCNWAQVERRNKQLSPLSFWIVHLNLCLPTKTKRETGCLWEMFHGGKQQPVNSYFQIKIKK